MSLHLFAGLRVRDFQSARAWYEQLLGEPTFFPHATEAVWTLADDRSVYVVEHPDGAGNSVVTIFLDDLDAQIAAIAGRGLQPDEREMYTNGVHIGDLPGPRRQRAGVRRCAARPRFAGLTRFSQDGWPCIARGTCISRAPTPDLLCADLEHLHAAEPAQDGHTELGDAPTARCASRCELARSTVRP